MNDRQDITFQELLRELGMGQYSGMLGSPEQVAANLGFGGQQAEEFAKFFPGFDQSVLLRAAESGRQTIERRGEELSESFQGGLGSLSQELGQRTREISEFAAQRGGTFGATERAREELAETSSESIADLLSRRETGLEAIRTQEQQQQASLIGLIQQAVQGAYRRGMDIYSLDPTMPGVATAAPMGYSPPGKVMRGTGTDTSFSGRGLMTRSDMITRGGAGTPFADPYFYETNPYG